MCIKKQRKRPSIKATSGKKVKFSPTAEKGKEQRREFVHKDGEIPFRKADIK